MNETQERGSEMQDEKWWASNNPEHYTVGPESSKEAAIEEYKIENDGEMPSYVGKSHPIYCEVDGQRIIENIPDDMVDNSYEDMHDGWCDEITMDQYADLSERLTKVLHDWLDEVKQPKSWDVIEQQFEVQKGEV